MQRLVGVRAMQPSTWSSTKNSTCAVSRARRWIDATRRWRPTYWRIALPKNYTHKLYWFGFDERLRKTNSFTIYNIHTYIYIGTWHTYIGIYIYGIYLYFRIYIWSHAIYLRAYACRENRISQSNAQIEIFVVYLENYTNMINYYYCWVHFSRHKDYFIAVTSTSYSHLVCFFFKTILNGSQKCLNVWLSTALSTHVIVVYAVQL